MMRRWMMCLLMVVPMLALSAAVQTTTLDVQGMTCSLCTVTVRKALQKVPGVKTVKVDLNQATATVQFDPAKTTPDDLVMATGDAGYRSSVRSGQPPVGR